MISLLRKRKANGLILVCVILSVIVTLGLNSTVANAANNMTIAAKPTTVTGLSIKVVSKSQLDLTWSAVGGANSYIIYRSSRATGTFDLVGTSTTTYYSNKDLKPNTTYFYKVSALNGVGEGTKSKATSGSTNAPGKVTGLRVKPNGLSQLDLNWTAVSGATSYEIYRSTSATGIYTSIGTSTTTQFSDIGLSTDISYYYTVSAVNGLGPGAKSGIVAGATKVPGKVTSLSVKVTSKRQLDLTWSVVGGASSYKIYRSTSSTGSFILLGTSTTSHFSNKGLEANTKYYYKVCAINVLGEGAKSAAVSGETKVPTRVTDLSVEQSTSNQLDLTWSAVSGASSYKVYRSKSAGGPYTSIGTSTTTSYSNKGLLTNTTYYYKVSALNGIGEGAKSITVSGSI